ncbi:MAG: Flp pilus assembly complex ATPase component TadA [Candidatus Omnitrophica bacterium]|nr:Flp pilus assembly complex ATPase component TadA [Candidatus Omnitrophota bacterium]
MEDKTRRQEPVNAEKFTRKRLGERLVEEGLITEEQFQIALKKHQESKVILRQILIDMGFITEERLMEFIGVSLGIPFMKDLAMKIIDPEVIKIIPEKTCRQYLVMPLFKFENVLTVAMADPFDVFVIDDLHSMAKYKIEPVSGKRDEIIKVIDRFYGSKGLLEEMVKGMSKEAEELEIIKEKKEEAVTEEELAGADKAPIIGLVDTMITQAIKERASDIHIEPDEEKLRIRYRVDGILRETMVSPKRLQASITSRIKIMASMDIATKRTPQDGRFKIRLGKKDIDVRVSCMPTVYGEKVVMRLLDQTSILINMEELGFNKECLHQFEELIKRTYGIILVTGPTGSGKTTTLYVALHTINSPDKNIITIEEPVEYNLEGVNQIPVNVKAGVTFAKGLRSILRQDPDVIMVGEMRDLETAEIAVRAALTGHLVFSTLHTNDASSSIVRMVDMGVPSYLVSSSVGAVLAQRLVRTICLKCKEPFQPSQDMLEEARLEGNPRDYTFYRGKGCENCGKTGYQGRIGLFELMVVDKKLRSLIHTGKSIDTIKEAAQKAGMRILWEDGIEKVLKGITTLEEVKRAAFMEEE